MITWIGSDGEMISTSFDVTHHIHENGTEYWSARELMGMLGYSRWTHFAAVIVQAKVICSGSGQEVRRHFAETSLYVPIGKGGMRKIEDYWLSRYAFCLVVVCSDTQKPELITVVVSLGLTALGIGEGVRPVEVYGISFPSDMPITKEQQTIGEIVRAFAHLHTVRQYRVSPYAIDLYFPDYRIAVECDEHGHLGRNYDQESEAQRQLHVEKMLGCQFVRYNPDAPNFHIGDVINEIIRIILLAPTK